VYPTFSAVALFAAPVDVIRHVCSYKELECLTPHMCNVCCVNDHMYCRNMKRVVAHELPNFAAGCIHCVACEHYRHSDTSVPTSRESYGKSRSLRWTNRHGDEKPSSRPVMSVEDLLCNEDMRDFESDLSNDGIEGTELLQIQLKARADQIFRSLGVTELPKSRSPPPTSVVPEAAVTIEEDSMEIEPEEYAAEVVIAADGLRISDLAQIDRVSDAVSETFIAGGREERETFFGDEARRSVDSHASSSTCSLASFDGTSPHEPPPVTVPVLVGQISDNRVMIKYPKYDSAPTEYIRLDVTFPNGATDDVINSYVKNDVARFICDKKSGLVPEVPVSVTVVKDDRISQTTEEESVSVAEAVMKTQCNAIHMVCILPVIVVIFDRYIKN